MSLFIAPLALSLDYDLIFATFLILVLIPCLYTIRADFWWVMYQLKEKIVGLGEGIS